MPIKGADATKRIIPVGPPRPGVTGAERVAAAPGEFQRLLESAVAAHGLRFSAHAQRRLESSVEPFRAEHLDRVARAVNLAQSKGSRESLVLMDGMALVVSVKNRTVITAVDMQRMKENVFTNIDSAVII
ncbi:MAG: hypothetical protein NUV93_07610 [Firmicutes bacterium]|nr:hypothetical protein [Bacillota bacterium]